MSAIAGIVNLNEEPVPIELGTRLMADLSKFPADDVQVWRKENVFLGCHAQWITPESVNEHLPYYDSIRRLAITADAIIDNRDELFDLLYIERDQRKLMSDSELILLAYHKWGEHAPKYLIGDFAFMIWDERNRRLFGARDFSGARTLYYCRNSERLAFCTVIQPLFSLPWIDKELNEHWLAEYLANPGMIETIDPTSTVYKKIEQLPPSHTITVTDGKLLFGRYLTVTNHSKPLKLKSDGEYEEAFRSVFQTAITARLRTHRNVGAFLSGGLDSGSIVSFAARTLQKENKRLYTYSYIPASGFNDWTFKSRMADERPFIQSTVQHVGNIADHYMDFEGKSPISDVDDWLDTLEMPYKFIENSYWLKGIYEQAHQQEVGILLNGGRGNYTISWGQAIDYYAILLKKFRWLRLLKEINLYSKNKGIKKSRVVSIIGKRAFPLVNPFAAKDRQPLPMLINPEFARKTEVFHRLLDHGIDPTGNSSFNFTKERIKRFERVYSWMVSGTSATKLSLRHALWGRDPTNDLRVIRFSLSVPDEQFVRNGLDRALIRRSTHSYLPDKVRLNQRVRGIQGADGIYRMIPAWNEFVEELEKLSSDRNLSEMLNIDVIKAAILKYREQPRPESIFDFEFKILLRSLIVYRFIQKLS